MTRLTALAPDRLEPKRMADLTDSERLFLCVFRRWLAGLMEGSGSRLSLAWNELAREFGAARARAVLSALIGLVRALGHVRRPLRHHRPCCAAVSADENAVLGFLAACQRQDWGLARGQAEWLVEADGVGDLMASGVKLSAALNNGGLFLPARELAPPPRTSGAAHMPSIAVH